MLTNKNNILQLIALLHQHGVEDVVLCPGSRNAPIVHSLQESALFRCHALTDERSAGFFALGQSLATTRPTAVCVTSGSALANLYPAVAEAYYQRVPLVVISADRPAAWIGQMDGQTMPQPDALGRMVRLSVNLPEGNTDEEVWHINRLINEALMECTHRGGGPVHINVPISEPLYAFDTAELPQVRTIRRIEGLSAQHLRDLAELLAQSHRRMIVIGQKPIDRSVKPAYLGELDRGFISLCEHLANLGHGHVAYTNPDGLVQAIPQGQEEIYAPDLLITLGGHIISKPLKQYLRKYPPRQHWHVSPDGEVADTYRCLTTVVEADPAEFVERLAYLMIGQENCEYPILWKSLAMQLSQAREQDVLAPFIQQLNQQPQAVLHLANSSAVRMVQRYMLHPDITVCCNRGINGIEGSLSAAVGFATATPERPNYVLIGDLSFFYDQNALWNTDLPHNLHILLLNSGGGKIFDTLPLPENPRSQDFICARQHYTAEHICRHYGIAYGCASSEQEWQSMLPQFMQDQESSLIEINV